MTVSTGTPTAVTQRVCPTGLAGTAFTSPGNVVTAGFASSSIDGLNGYRSQRLVLSAFSWDITIPAGATINSLSLSALLDATVSDGVFRMVAQLYNTGAAVAVGNTLSDFLSVALTGGSPSYYTAGGSVAAWGGSGVLSAASIRDAANFGIGLGVDDLDFNETAGGIDAYAVPVLLVNWSPPSTSIASRFFRNSRLARIDRRFTRG